MFNFDPFAKRAMEVVKDEFRANLIKMINKQKNIEITNREKANAALTAMLKFDNQQSRMTGSNKKMMFQNASMNSINAESVISVAMQRSNDSRSSKRKESFRKRGTENIGIQIGDLAELESLDDMRSDLTQPTIQGGEVNLNLNALQKAAQSPPYQRSCTMNSGESRRSSNMKKAGMNERASVAHSLRKGASFVRGSQAYLAQENEKLSLSKSDRTPTLPEKI